MAASKSKAQPMARPLENVPPDQKPAKNRTKPRKPKGKGVLLQPQPDLPSEPGPSSETTAEIEDIWSWTSLTDSSASTHPAVFTKDGRYFFSIVGSSIKIHASSTGHVVSTLSVSTLGGSTSRSDGGHTAKITSALLNPHNPFQLITASLDGCIKFWDYLDGTLLQTIRLPQPIFMITANDKVKDYIFAVTSRGTKRQTAAGKITTEDNTHLYRVSLLPTSETEGLPVQESSEVIGIGKLRTPNGLAVSPSGSWVVAISGHKAHIASTTNPRAGFKKFTAPEHLTCLTFHPSDDCFATGDSKGAIRLWYCLTDGSLSEASGLEKRAQTTSFHWHAHAVSSLVFTPNGAYLLSGGEEAVLVIWQLHTNKKEFVPRVGAPISTIAISPVGGVEEEYLLGLSDSTYTFISSGSLRVSRAFSQLKLDPLITPDALSASTPVPLAVHPLSSSLILTSSHPSSLQAYSPTNSRLIYDIEVSPSNRVSRRDEKHLEPPRVRHVAVSASGEWMATVDSRIGDEGFRPEVYLKIWWWDRKSGFWILNSRINRPHGLNEITSISFSPILVKENMLLVTTGEDKRVKTWRLRTNIDRKGEVEDFWVPRSSFHYRSELPSHASWSSDASLIAVAAGPFVPIYDSNTNALLQVLVAPECGCVTSVHFLGSSGRFFVVAGERDLVLWDLVSQTIQWHFRSGTPIGQVVAHPSEDKFALLQSRKNANSSQQETRVLLFRPGSAIPFRTCSIPFGVRNVTWYSLAEGTTVDFNLVGITDSWGVALFGDDVRSPSSLEGTTTTQIASGAYLPRKNALLHDIFGKSAFDDVTHPTTSAETSVFVPREGKQAVTSFFDTPAYLMPPLETAFDSIMQTFLVPRSTAKGSEGGVKQAEKDEEEMDVDEEQVPEDDGPLIVKDTTRVVDEREMHEFVEIFKHYGLTAVGSRKTASHTYSNGINGVSTRPNNFASSPAPTRINGIAATHPTEGRGKPPVETPQTQASPPSASTTPVKVGKKRKKSSG